MIIIQNGLLQTYNFTFIKVNIKVQTSSFTIYFSFYAQS